MGVPGLPWPAPGAYVLSFTIRSSVLGALHAVPGSGPWACPPPAPRVSRPLGRPVLALEAKVRMAGRRLGRWHGAGSGWQGQSRDGAASSCQHLPAGRWEASATLPTPSAGIGCQPRRTARQPAQAFAGSYPHTPSTREPRALHPLCATKPRAPGPPGWGLLQWVLLSGCTLQGGWGQPADPTCCFCRRRPTFICSKPTGCTCKTHLLRSDPQHGRCRHV